MKKLFISLVAVMAMAFSANAQFYAGGGLGLAVVSSGESTAAFVLSPEFGYDFSEKLAAGASLEVAATPFTFAFNPYFRWKFAGINSVKFFTDFTLSLGSAGKAFMWGISVMPGMSFDITPKFSFVTRVASIGVIGASGGAAFRLNLLSSGSVGFFYHF